MLTIALTAGLPAILPVAASAYATIAPSPIYSSASGLPDGRVYEQVSPPDKNGNEAGSGALQQPESQIDANYRYSLAAADGNSVLFETTGPMGEAAAGYSIHFVAQRSAAGWIARSVMPREQQAAGETGGTLDLLAAYLDPSPDLSHAMFTNPGGDNGSTYALNMPSKCPSQLYLSGSDPFAPATWLSRPEISDPVGSCADESVTPTGGTPNFSTVYFTDAGTLLPEDVLRAPYAALGSSWGFYEDKEGALREAGVLPDGSLDPFGAVPAVSGHGRGTAIYNNGNEVSADGSRAFFVSPDPASCEEPGIERGGTIIHGPNNCTVDPPELYVREDGTRTVLVSQDKLLPAVGGLPAPAPTRLLYMPNPSQQTDTVNQVPDLSGVDGSYVFASPDGSQAFFQSDDQLTDAAPEGPPGNTSPKTYDFDVNTGSLTYLPGVVGQIVAVDTDGSSLAFVNSEVSPAELDLWSAGPGGGGVVTPITQLPGGDFEPARISSDGSAVVFTTMNLAGFNDAGVEEIFRYDVPTNTLACVSCAPAGVTLAGASMSRQRELDRSFRGFGSDAGLVEPRGVSSDGDRIFFETSAPLVPQDTNTASTALGDENGHQAPIRQGGDVYEWENGVVYLISTGKSQRDSYFLDNSEDGDDVFFATAEGLVPGDVDGAYDVYDARVPHPGDTLPPAAVPCEGSVCQGPPRVPSPLAAPASATFSGLGNPTPEPVAMPRPSKKTTTKTVKCKRGFTKKKNKCLRKAKPKKSKKSSRGSK